MGNIYCYWMDLFMPKRTINNSVSTEVAFTSNSRNPIIQSYHIAFEFWKMLMSTSPSKCSAVGLSITGKYHNHSKPYVLDLQWIAFTFLVWKYQAPKPRFGATVYLLLLSRPLPRRFLWKSISFFRLRWFSFFSDFDGSLSFPFSLLSTLPLTYYTE